MEAAFNAKYLSRVDKFLKRELKYGYTRSVSTMSEFIHSSDRKLWDSIVSNPGHYVYDPLPQQRQLTVGGFFGIEVIISYYHVLSVVITTL